MSNNKANNKARKSFNPARSNPVFKPRKPAIIVNPQTNNQIPQLEYEGDLIRPITPILDSNGIVSNRAEINKQIQLQSQQTVINRKTHPSMSTLSPTIKKIILWKRDPVQFVLDNFKAIPEAWQADVLRALTDPAKFRIAMQAAAGVGKSTVMAWASWWAFTLHGSKTHRPVGNALSETETNLKVGLWKELALWQKQSEWLKHEFQWTASKIFHKKQHEDWVFNARTYNQNANVDEIGSTLSGTHSQYMVWAVDETGRIPPKIAHRIEQSIPGTVRIWILQAGNPLCKTGMLYHCTVKNKADHFVVRITADPDDPKRSTRVPIDLVRKEIREMGRDNAWVKAYRLGEFPDNTCESLFSYTDYERVVKEYTTWTSQDHNNNSLLPTTIGIDVSFGGLDRTVISSRTGRRFNEPIILRTSSVTEITQALLHHIQDIKKFSPTPNYNISNIFIDGAGVGNALVEHLQHQIYDIPIIGIMFGGAPQNKNRYKNKRAEMIDTLREAIANRGFVFPPNHDLMEEGNAVTIETHKDGHTIITPKEVIRDRLGNKSPDISDAMALTFGYPDFISQTTMPDLDPTSPENMLKYHPLPHPSLFQHNGNRTVVSQSRLSYNPFNNTNSVNNINRRRKH